MKNDVKKIAFTKMHGLGNDYIYVDCFEPQTADIIAQTDLACLAREVSDRHFGIGSDGLVLIIPSDEADARMRIFNADGSEAQMCGNAIRCVGKYLYESGLCRQTKMRIQTLSGIRALRLHTTNGQVDSAEVHMGKAQVLFDEPMKAHTTFRVGGPADAFITVKSIKEMIVTGTGRVSSLKVTGSTSSKTLGLQEAQSVFDLPSAKYKVVLGGTSPVMPYAVSDDLKERLFGSGLYAITGSGTLSKLDTLEQLIVVSDDNMMNFPLMDVPAGSVAFFGMGYGHGIGMSQSCAQGLAVSGFDYKEIINYYFDDIRIDKYHVA